MSVRSEVDTLGGIHLCEGVFVYTGGIYLGAGTSGLLASTSDPVGMANWSLLEGLVLDEMNGSSDTISSAEFSVGLKVISSMVDSRVYAGESHIISNNPLQSYSLSQKFRDRQTAFMSSFEDSGSLSGEFSTIL